MRLPIYVYGQPVLRQQCVKAEKGAEDYPTLAANMFETMYDAEGVGLAAPQIGKNIQMLVVDGDLLKDDIPECAGMKRVIINPEYEILDGEPVSRPEGCLSLPGLSEDVSRVENIRVRYMDENFVEHDEVFTGFFSRMVQHELDHLEGRLFTDHVTGLRRQMISSKLKKMASGKVRASYPIR